MKKIPIQIGRVLSFKDKLQQLKGSDSDAIRDGSVGCCFTIKFSEQSIQTISHMVFRNFYAARLRLEQQTPDQTIVLLDDYTLMKDPNYEDDAQDWHIIHINKLKNKIDLSALKTLDVYLYQPSSLWAKYELQDLNFFEIDPADPLDNMKSLTPCQSPTPKSPQSPLKSPKSISKVFSRINLASPSPTTTSPKIQNNSETHLQIQQAHKCLDLLVQLRQQIHSS